MTASRSRTEGSYVTRGMATSADSSVTMRKGVGTIWFESLRVRLTLKSKRRATRFKLVTDFKFGLTVSLLHFLQLFIHTEVRFLPNRSFRTKLLVIKKTTSLKLLHCFPAIHRVTRNLVSLLFSSSGTNPFLKMRNTDGKSVLNNRNILGSNHRLGTILRSNSIQSIIQLF